MISLECISEYRKTEIPKFGRLLKLKSYQINSKIKS